MEESNKTNEEQSSPLIKREQPEWVKELCKAELREKVAIMASFAQELVRQGPDTLFLTVVLKQCRCFLGLSEVLEGVEKAVLQKKTLDLAKAIGADCLVSASLAWSAPDNPFLKPSHDPERKEILMVLAKDHSSHVAAIQEVHRSDDQVRFGGLEYADSVQSWLDKHAGFDHPSGTC